MARHELTKTAKSNIERLPDENGAVVSYADAPECEATSVERVAAEPTVQAGATGSAGTVSGLVTSMSAKSMYGKRIAGNSGPGDIWELTTTVASDAASI